MDDRTNSIQGFNIRYNDVGYMGCVRFQRGFGTDIVRMKQAIMRVIQSLRDDDNLERESITYDKFNNSMTFLLHQI